MRNLKVPTAAGDSLFDTEKFGWWHSRLSASAIARLENGMEGFFRRSILALMPAVAIGVEFDEEIGCPTKELFAMCGLLLWAEFHSWSVDETADAFAFNAAIQFALNLPPDRQYLCPRTVDNYRRLFRKNEVAQGVFESVTAHIVAELELNIRKQRLDSTHVLSNMAKFGRLKLLAVCVHRFFVQLKKHRAPVYEALPAELRGRYDHAESRLFFAGKKRAETERASVYAEQLAQVGEDLGTLIAEFGEDSSIARWETFAALTRVFGEHFELSEDRIELRPKSEDENGESARTLQNPSDLGASYDGHKGAGYKVQLSQAYDHGEEAPGIITACVPQTAADADSASLGAVHEQQKRMGTLPAAQLADTAYGSQANVELAAQNGVALEAPVPGQKPIKREPATNAPQTANEARRAKQESDEWKQEYAARSGGEGLNATLKNQHGMRRLRVRGDEAVKTSIYLKVAGWNVQTAVKIIHSRRRRAARAVAAALPTAAAPHHGANRSGRDGNSQEIPTRRRIMRRGSVIFQAALSLRNFRKCVFAPVSIKEGMRWTPFFGQS